MVDDETKYSYDEIIEFCHDLEIVVATRESTREFLYRYGKTKDDLINEIRTIGKAHILAGIEPDIGEGRKGYVYQFEKMVFEKTMAYIKVKIKIDKDKKLFVLSFHEEDSSNYERKSK